ncbi:hypothetical protein PLEOSDRAFT_162504 [Pleurotus ostreatus PC15]|uniref:Uncharacterized protein n=1 Tax=Pleurotus ostreatus (strain PC15) TaxID=1137138 RepID=A0A067N614_PLEO1|nr:hypothetical protein PLEOSDRAFT_162504 [Pleurotus ostreatus PC15]
MSTVTIFGFFGLANSKPSVSQSSGSSRSYHTHYSTVIQCSAGCSLPADVRIYAPLTTPALPDNTVAFIVARAHFPPDEPAALDAYHIIPMPGDPNSDAYEDSLPDCPFPFVFLIGHVPVEPVVNGNIKTTTVHAQEYVRNTIRLSTVECVVDAGTPRWANTPMPRANTVVHFSGTCLNVSRKGALMIAVENVALGVGSGHSSSDPLASPSASPKKKRKFQTHASPHPISVPSTPLSLSVPVTPLVAAPVASTSRIHDVPSNSALSSPILPSFPGPPSPPMLPAAPADDAAVVSDYLTSPPQPRSDPGKQKATD